MTRWWADSMTLSRAWRWTLLQIFNSFLEVTRTSLSASNKKIKTREGSSGAVSILEFIIFCDMAHCIFSSASPSSNILLLVFVCFSWSLRNWSHCWRCLSVVYLPVLDFSISRFNTMIPAHDSIPRVDNLFAKSKSEPQGFTRAGMAAANVPPMSSRSLVAFNMKNYVKVGHFLYPEKGC